ncbi:type II secretion system protein [Humisphaera borealis]|uniref:type II secretion system protein n=1 Tax=Humisphaera borealis TaxID=2807512 RepID=UPI0021BCD2C5|nr:prepilin-type N-terminal cleavage/methylation domain-containing protein [Humisphaera borealis]
MKARRHKGGASPRSLSASVPPCPRASSRSASSRRASARRNRGFTLVEVLATILMLAIIVPVAMQAVSLATGISGAARHRAEAAALAESQLAFLMTSGEWQTGTLQGDFAQQGFPEYQWYASVGNWTEANVQQLDVMVLWTTPRRGEESVVVSTLVYQLGADDSTGDAAATGATP